MILDTWYVIFVVYFCLVATCGSAEELTNYFGARHISTTLCRDDFGSTYRCLLEQALGMCRNPSVYNKCKLTCGTCGDTTWTDWQEWSKCSVSCGSGTNVRMRLCTGRNCPRTAEEQLKGCEVKCESERPSVSNIVGKTYTERRLYDVTDFETEEKVCGTTEYQCPDSKDCIESTQRCDGVRDCNSGKDEIDCGLGLRYDGLFGIINWEKHMCVEAKAYDDLTLPVMHRRCPGPLNDKKPEFMWEWRTYSSLRHVSSRLCLKANATYFNGTDEPEIKLLLAPCDSYDRQQQWRCSGFRIQLSNPYYAVPGWDVKNIFVKINDSAGSEEANLVFSDGNDEKSYFYMHGTNKRLNICARIYGTGTATTWNWWSMCDKTCGGGTQTKKKDGISQCVECDLYERRRCNTHACPVDCPPGFALHVSPRNRNDKNCFKVYNEPKTFADAERFCEANNWTLAASKDDNTNRFLVNLMRAAGANDYYIGVHEKVKGFTEDDDDNAMIYLLDDQPVGSFQPWHKSSSSGDKHGCTVGYGVTYSGTMNVTSTGRDCYGVNQFCRNSDADMMAPWCHVRYGRRIAKETCDVPNCMDFDAEDDRAIKHRYNFNIRSLEGEDGHCISVLSSDVVVSAACDCSDRRQNFQWLYGTYLINAQSGKCLSLLSFPPEHGTELTATKCPAGNVPLRQGWHVDGGILSVRWNDVSSDDSSAAQAFTLEHSTERKTVLISDIRTEQFTAWSPNLGLTSLRQLVSSTVGSQFVMKGDACGRCLTSSDNSKRLTLSSCDMRDYHQRWTKREKSLMNVATGLCLNAFDMRFYVVLDECKTGDKKSEWIFNLVDGSFWIRLDSTKFYLTCGCTGYTSVCLNPDKSQAGKWEMTLNEKAPSAEEEISAESVSEAFTLRSALNSTLCAYPYKTKDESDKSFRISMVPCVLHNTGQLWWFSHDGSWIRHRGLGECVHSCKDDGCLVTLEDCSQSQRDFQSWSVVSENEESVDRVCLKSNREMCLSLRRDSDADIVDYMLSVKILKRSRHWIGEIAGGVYVPLDTLNDCVPPWTTMGDYRGATSWTLSGIKCQKWAAQWPHRHPFTPDTHRGDGLDENFCRRPPGIPTDKLEDTATNEAWCVTLNPMLPWERCDVTRCSVAGVAVNSVTGLWKPSGGEIERPFVCQAVQECYIENGVSYSGYYTHSGRSPCLNWREYYEGAVEWPDHARCMNWNNDTYKPWCWVKKGVAQYCEVANSCPVACQDPRFLMRNMRLVNVSYASSSKNYMPGSTVAVVCERGFRSANKHQTWECASNGKWTPRPEPCTRVMCPEPTTFDNAVMVTPANFFYGAKVAYHCKNGSMIEPGRNSIEITCLANGSWSQLPYKCVAGCRSGYVSYNRSCYKLHVDKDHYLNYTSALKSCSANNGSLAVPRTRHQYEFLQKFVVGRGLADQSYWLGVRNSYDEDAAASGIFKDWVGDGVNAEIPERELYLDTFQNFTFMITSFSHKSGDKKSFLDQCLYADLETNNVLVKSCVYADADYMKWMWIKKQHLYNLKSGLCLEMRGAYLGLYECDPDDVWQMFTCGPDNGYILRNSGDRYKFVTLKQTTSDGDITIADDATLEEKAMWLTYPDRQYLCHWNIRPPGEIFLVHKGDFPTFASFHAEDPDLCLANLTGSRLATVAEIRTSTDVLNGMHNYISWCACLFARDNDGAVTTKLVSNFAGCSAHEIPTTIRDRTKDCHPLNFADSLCRFPDGPDPEFLSEKCAAMKMNRLSEVEFSTRQCRVPLPGHICEEPAMWACGDPPVPKNAKPVAESLAAPDLKFAYGSTIKVSCEDGHWIKSLHRYDLTIRCNQHLNWELEELYEIRDENEEKYVRSGGADAGDIYGAVECERVECGEPPLLYGLETVNETDRTYYAGDTLLFRCAPGTWFNSTSSSHAVTCTADGTWQPPLGKDQICTVIECPKPGDIPFANMSYSGLVYASVVNYTCVEGFWISKDNRTVSANCSSSGRWEPDYLKANVTCMPSSCENPSPEELSSSVVGMGKVTTYLKGVALTLTCKRGYWFDKGAHQATFTCDKTGKWKPYHPHESHCKQIYCQEPEEVAGATKFGSDYASGSHIRYYCSRRYWIRKQFQIYNSQWKLCLRSEDTANSKITKSTHRKVVVDGSCGPAAFASHFWQWHWTFHIKNMYTSLCLTATALTIIKEDSVPVRLEICDRNNVMQMWTCESARNGWALRLWSTYDGGYLAAHSRTRNFWSEKNDLEIVLTGKLDYTSNVVSWNTYHYKDEDLSVCIMKEGRFYEKVECNNYGLWQPDPFHIECTVVRCDFPPDATNAHISSNYSANVNSYAEKDAHLRWRHVLIALNQFDVGTTVVYICNTGFWISENVYTYTLTCLDNGLWSPDPDEVKCVPAFCPVPDLGPWMRVIVEKNSSAPAELDFLSVFPKRGWKEFRYPLDTIYEAKYAEVATLLCDDGYWLTSRTSSGGRRTDSSVSAHCLEDGRWSKSLLISSDTRCELLTCRDPGLMENAERVSFTGDGGTNPSHEFVYQSVVQYKCNTGFWISIAKRYLQISCGRDATWVPDPSLFSCVPISCGEPGSIANGVKVGSDYALNDEVIYKCNEGYRFGNFFLRRVVKCTKDGNWFPPSYSIVCDPVECGDPPTFDNSNVETVDQRFADKYVFGDLVTMKCDDGYVSVDKIRSNYTCNSDGDWEPATFADRSYQCEPAECGKPAFPSRFTIYETTRQYFVNDTVHYSCPAAADDDGFIQVGLVTCAFDSTKVSGPWTLWRPTPGNIKCNEAPDCPFVDLLPNTTLSVEGYKPGNVATFTCLPGFESRNTNSSTRNMFCNAYGHWRPSTLDWRCVPVRCPQPVLNDLIQMDASRDSPETFGFGDKIQLTCPDGFWVMENELSGSRGQFSVTVECDYVGTWSLEPDSVVCAEVFCEMPTMLRREPMEITKLNESYPSRNDRATKLHVTCNEGYLLSFNGEKEMEFECSHQGIWTPLDLDFNTIECVLIMCPDPGTYANSIRHGKSFEYGRQVLYEALPGYWSTKLESPSVRLICSADGTWVHADTESSDRAKRSVSDTIKELLKFSPLECVLPKTAPKNSKFILANSSAIRANTFTIACDSGFVISPGVRQRDPVCTVHGFYPPPELLFCAPEDSVFCKIPSVPNLLTTDSSHVTSGIVLKLTCEMGYELNGDETESEIECLENGLWDPQWNTVECVKYTCVKPPEIENATRAWHSGNNSAYYSCQTGYSFQDDKSRTQLETICDVKRRWVPSPSDYKCVSTFETCGVPEFHKTGTFRYKPEITFKCNAGYKVYLHGVPYASVKLKCSDGSWRSVDHPEYTDKAMICVVIKCNSDPPNIANGAYTMYSGNSFESTVTYHCMIGYGSPAGPKKFRYICTSTGAWVPHGIDAADAKCERVPCPAIPSIPGESVVEYEIAGVFSAATTPPDWNRYGSRIRYHCQLAGPDVYVYTCNWNGQWDPYLKQPCEVINCHTPPVVAHSTSSGGSTRNSVYKIQCDTGYEFSKYVYSKSFQCLKISAHEAQWVPPLDDSVQCTLPRCPAFSSFSTELQFFDQHGVRYDPSRDNWHELDLYIGSFLTMTCNDGYSDRLGPRKLECLPIGGWRVDIPVGIECNPITCDLPMSIPNAGLVNKTATNVTFPNYVQYECDPYFFFEAQRTTTVWLFCNESGLLMPDPTGLECVPVSCEKTTVKNAKLQRLTGLGFGATATYRCDTDMRFPSDREYQTFDCKADGNWYPNITENYCDSDVCRTPSLSRVVFETDAAEYGESIESKCISGYHLVDYENAPVRYVICGGRGLFKPDPMRLTCKRVRCPAISAPENATVSTNDYYGAVAVLKCYDGYVNSEGDTYVTSTCLEGGWWSMDLSKRKYACTPGECPEYPEVRNAVRIGAGRRYRAQFRMVCKDGYHMAGASRSADDSISVTCSKDLEWDTPAAVTCERISCPDLRPVNFARLFGDGKYSGDTYTYVCKPMSWIAEMQDGEYKITGRKEFLTTCGNDGNWEPAVNFQCLNLFEAERAVMGRAAKISNSVTLEQLQRHWIKFQPDTMTITDSGYSKSTTSDSLSYNIEAIWDSNPLTYWVSSETYSVDDGWGVDIYFGKPILVHGFMLMGLDDSKSGVANVSLIYADSKNAVSRKGPFQVYGTGVLTGTVVSNFPLQFSSVANCFVYEEGLDAEILWLHMILRPLNEKTPVKMREIGFFASELQYLSEAPAYDPTLLYFYIILLVLTLILTPALYLVDYKYSKVRISYGCCGVKRPCNVVQFSVSFDQDTKCQLLIQMLGTRGEGPVAWIDSLKATTNRRKNIHSLHVPGNVTDIGVITKIRMMAWKDASKQDIELQDAGVVYFKGITVTNTKRSDMRLLCEDVEVLMPFFEPSEISLWDCGRSRSELILSRVGDILRSNLLFSLLFPPNSRSPQRAERFLCLSLMCASGSAFALLFAGFFTTLFGRSIAPVWDNDVLNCFFGALVVSPLPSVLRFLYATKRKSRASGARGARNTFDVQSVMKVFLGLLEVRDAATSITAVEISDKAAAFSNKKMRRSLSCGSLCSAKHSRTVPNTIYQSSLPVRLSLSCQSLTNARSAPRSNRAVMFPSASPNKSRGKSGKRLVTRYYTDVLQLNRVRSYHRKTMFHILVSPVLFFFIAASSSFAIAQFAQLDRHMVDVTSVLLYSVLFTILLSLNVDMFFAVALFKESS